MSTKKSIDELADSIAHTIYQGYEKHYRLFREITSSGKKFFENGDINAEKKAIKTRINFYDIRIQENIEEIKQKYSNLVDQLEIWPKVKLFYLSQLMDCLRPELAETFFNSVLCRILDRDYFHNKYIFRRPLVSLDYLEGELPSYSNYYPQSSSFRKILKKILIAPNWQISYQNINQDIAKIILVIANSIGAGKNQWPKIESNCHIKVLNSPFYQNVAAYLIGILINGEKEFPFAIVVRTSKKSIQSYLYVDALILDRQQISSIFSLSRLYFMVDMDVPSAYVRFLQNIMPNKPRAEIYTMLGLGKQGKTDFYRDLIYHLNNSEDKFVIAPGIPGLVMMVFMLPSFPFVFKIIRDKFGTTKSIDHNIVKEKYTLVKQVDRVGRMADTIEYSDVALPINRFTDDLLESLKQTISSLLDFEQDTLFIKHLYIERRVQPLNMYITQMEAESNWQNLERAIIEYGNAIRELAQANIFPGDMLWKNFGINRYGRVIFYDYDEIELMTKCNFRKIPPCPYPEMELSDDPWYSVGINDIFPEEFDKFLLGSKKNREIFLKYHADLLNPEYWQSLQKNINENKTIEHFPYPLQLRFKNITRNNAN